MMTGEKNVAAQTEKNRKLLAELTQFRLVLQDKQGNTTRLKKSLDEKEFDSLVDLITTTIKPESWKDAGNGEFDVDGESVALALRSITGVDAPPDIVEKVAERVRATVEQHAWSLTTPQAVTVSLGVATFPRDANATRELVAAAERALKLAKQRGRNCVALCSVASPVVPAGAVRRRGSRRRRGR